jgi:hypothetical protein
MTEDIIRLAEAARVALIAKTRRVEDLIAQHQDHENAPLLKNWRDLRLKETDAMIWENVAPADLPSELRQALEEFQEARTEYAFYYHRSPDHARPALKRDIPEVDRTM